MRECLRVRCAQIEEKKDENPANDELTQLLEDLETVPDNNNKDFNFIERLNDFNSRYESIREKYDELNMPKLPTSPESSRVEVKIREDELF